MDMTEIGHFDHRLGPHFSFDFFDYFFVLSVINLTQSFKNELVKETKYFSEILVGINFNAIFQKLIGKHASHFFVAFKIIMQIA